MKNVVAGGSMKYMNLVIGLILTAIIPIAKADSAFLPFVGKYEVVALSSDCANSLGAALCIQESDIVIISSSIREATLSAHGSNNTKSKLNILMQEYDWEEDGHFSYAKFESFSGGAGWSEGSNRSRQYLSIRSKSDLYVLEASLRSGGYYRGRYQIVMRKIQ